MGKNVVGKNVFGEKRLWGKMSQGKTSFGEKCHMGKNVVGKNVAGKYVGGKNVFWGKMSYIRLQHRKIYNYIWIAIGNETERVDNTIIVHYFEMKLSKKYYSPQNYLTLRRTYLCETTRAILILIQGSSLSWTKIHSYTLIFWQVIIDMDIVDSKTSFLTAMAFWPQIGLQMT